jgi:hypothetical protein
MYTLNDLSVYIFNWKKVTENSLQLYKKISEIVKDTTLVNCDEHFKPKNKVKHVQLDDSYYYGSQYDVAIKQVAPGKIFCIVVGDNISKSNFRLIFESAIKTFNNHNVGIYAPNDKRTVHTKKTAHYVDKLFQVPNTDCGFWFIHPAIVDRLRSIDYRLSNLGWGIDIINIKEAQKQGRLVLRDYSIETDQLDHTCGYNVKEASVGSKVLEEIYSKLDLIPKTEAVPL